MHYGDEKLENMGKDSRILTREFYQNLIENCDRKGGHRQIERQTSVCLSSVCDLSYGRKQDRKSHLFTAHATGVLASGVVQLKTI